jgi:hypothetical protein
MLIVSTVSAAMCSRCNSVVIRMRHRGAMLMPVVSGLTASVYTGQFRVFRIPGLGWRRRCIAVIVMMIFHVALTR